MGSSIQFRGKRAVLKAFENYSDAEAWAIFQAKQLNFKGIGGDELAAVLDMLEPSGSDAVYILKVYEEIEDKRLIKEKTDADGSFAFKLGEEGALMGSLGSPAMRYYEERIKKLEEKIAAEDEEDEEDKTIGGRIGNALLGLIEQPNELIQLIGAFKQLTGPQPANIATIGRINPDFSPPMYSDPGIGRMPLNNSVNYKIHSEMPEKAQTKAEAQNDEEKMLRMAAAINILEEADPKVIEHLEALAKIAKENPPMFKMLLTTLDNY